MHDLVLKGMVAAVFADQGHHFSKIPQREIVMREGHGVEGDAHEGPFVRQRHLARRQPRLPNLRQVHPIPAELFDTQRRYRCELDAGELEVRTSPWQAWTMSECPGSRMWPGSTAVVELTGLRTPCVLIDRFRSGLKRRVISPEKAGPAFRCGVLGIVRTGGRVATAISRERCCRALPGALVSVKAVRVCERAVAPQPPVA